MTNPPGRPRKYATVEEAAELRKEIADLRAQLRSTPVVPAHDPSSGEPSPGGTLESMFSGLAILSLISAEGRSCVGREDLGSTVDLIGNIRMAWLFAQGKIEEGLALRDLYAERAKEVSEWIEEQRRKRTGGGYGGKPQTLEQLERRLRAAPSPGPMSDAEKAAALAADPARFKEAQGTVE